MKKVLIFLLAISLIFSFSSIGLASAQISDYYGHWAEDTITKWIDDGLIEGYNDGTFKPNDEISKVEFITLVNRIYGYYVEAEDNYKDVSNSIWYSTDCKIAKANGYMDWYQENELNPKESILREEVFAILASIMQLKSTDDLSGIEQFTDKEEISDWSIKYMDALAANGYIEGNADKSVEPIDTITRAEAVTMLDRVMGELINKSGTYVAEVGEKEQIIKGNLTINTKDVVLQNMKIEGDLILAAGIADGDVDLNNVIVAGRTIINGGGDNSIHITGSSLREIKVYKVAGQIRVVMSGSETEKVIIQSGGTLEGQYGDAEIIIDTEKEQEVILDGCFENILIDSPVNIQLEGNSIIKEMTFNSSSNVRGTGTIEQALINADRVNIDQNIKEKITNKDSDSNSLVTPSTPIPPSPTIPEEVSPYYTLSIAFDNNNFDTVKELLDNGLEIRDIDFVSSIDTNNVDIIQLFIDKGVDINIKSPFGIALMRAADNNNLEIVNFLIENGADVNISNFDGATPLTRAAQRNNLEIVNILITNGADINAVELGSNTALTHAIRNENIEMVTILLDAGSDPNYINTFNASILFFAIDTKNEDVVKILLENGADPNGITNQGYPILYLVSVYIFSEDEDGNLILIPPNIEIVNLLIEHGADATDNNVLSKVIGSSKVDLEIVEVLLKAGADPNGTDESGMSYLKRATIFGNNELANLLRLYGADEPTF